MEKSIFFLLGSMVMLTIVAAISIGKATTFTNAMAIEMDSQVKKDTQLFANDQASKTNSISDITTFNVIDVLLPQQAQISQKDSNVPPPGLSRLNQITPENLYFVRGEAPQGDFIVDTATCDPGDIAISGGIQGAMFDGAIERITDRPDVNELDFDTWLVALSGQVNDPDDRGVVVAFAQCFDNPPLRP
jgi:hypothetical protein